MITFLKSDGDHSWLGTEDGKVLYTKNAETYAMPRGFGDTFYIPKHDGKEIEVPIRSFYAGPRKRIDACFVDGTWYVFDKV